MANYSFTFKEDSLSHHGIDGQKWGVRNGPPYPLAAGDHSAAEKRAMRKNYNVVKKTKLVRWKRTDPIRNKHLGKEVDKRINDYKSDIIKAYYSNKGTNIEEIQTISNKIAKECLGKYADRQIYAKVKGALTDFGVAKYGTVHNLGSAEEVLTHAISNYVIKSMINE